MPQWLDRRFHTVVRALVFGAWVATRTTRGPVPKSVRLSLASGKKLTPPLHAAGALYRQPWAADALAQAVQGSVELRQVLSPIVICRVVDCHRGHSRRASGPWWRSAILSAIRLAAGPDSALKVLDQAGPARKEGEDVFDEKLASIRTGDPYSSVPSVFLRPTRTWPPNRRARHWL